MIRVTFTGPQTNGAPAVVTHIGARVTLAGPMLLLDGKQIARKPDLHARPCWLDAHGHSWDRIEFEVSP